jgi:hypothetical protein
MSSTHPLFKHLYVNDVDSFGYSVRDNMAMLRTDIGMIHGELVDSLAFVKG